MQVLANATAILSIENILFLGEIPNHKSSGHRTKQFNSSMVLSVSQAMEIAGPMLPFSSQGAWTLLGLHVLDTFGPPCAWGTQDVSWQEHHTVVRRWVLAQQELPELLLRHSQPEIWTWG